MRVKLGSIVILRGEPRNGVSIYPAIVTRCPSDAPDTINMPVGVDVTAFPPGSPPYTAERVLLHDVDSGENLTAWWP